MSIRKMRFEAAAKLLTKHRDAMLAGRPDPALADVSPDTLAQAALTHDNVLLITGSNDLADYRELNLRPLRLAAKRARTPLLVKGIGQGRLHAGFAVHADKVLSFLGDRRPAYILGHSLGAASAQILGRALRVPTIAFASPQVFKTGVARGEVPGERWVMNVVWQQDFVTLGFKLLGYRTLGSIVRLDTPRRNIGMDHFMDDYKKLIAFDRAAMQPKLPMVWPKFAVPSTLVA